MKNNEKEILEKELNQINGGGMRIITPNHTPEIVEKFKELLEEVRKNKKIDINEFFNLLLFFS